MFYTYTLCVLWLSFTVPSCICKEVVQSGSVDIVGRDRNAVMPQTFPFYRFKGILKDSAHSTVVPFANVVLMNGEVPINGCASNMDGEYDIRMSRADVMKLTRIAISTDGYQSISLNITSSNLSGPVVVLDFNLILKPMEYSIIYGYQDHLGGSPISVDTVWVDEKDNPLPRKREK